MLSTQNLKVLNVIIPILPGRKILGQCDQLCVSGVDSHNLNHYWTPQSLTAFTDTRFKASYRTLVETDIQRFTSTPKSPYPECSLPLFAKGTVISCFFQKLEVLGLLGNITLAREAVNDA